MLRLGGGMSIDDPNTPTRAGSVGGWWGGVKTLAWQSYQNLQIKSSGASVDTNPTLTFTLKSNYGLHAEFFEDHHGTTQYTPMLSLNDAKGKWIQVGLILRAFNYCCFTNQK